MYDTTKDPTSGFNKLAEQTNPMSDLLENLPCVVFLCHFTTPDAIPSFSFISPTVKQLLGLDVETLMRDPTAIFMILLPEELPRLQVSIRDAVASGSEWKDEFWVRVDGKLRWIGCRTKIKRCQDGMTSVYGYLLDSTEHKMLELKNLETHERFRRTFEAGPQPIGISDAAGNITAVNPAYTRLFGYTREDIPTLDVCFEKLFPNVAYRARVAQEWSESLQQFEQTGIPANPIVIRGQSKDGTERIAEIRSTVASGENIVFFVDITDQVRLEEERKKAAADRDMLLGQLHFQVDRMPIGLVYADATDDLTIREWNPAAERIFGYTREEIVGKSPHEFIIPPEGQNLVVNAVRSTHSDGTVRVVSTNRTKDGRTIWCEWFSYALHDDSGKDIQIVAMVQDITEQVKAEERAKLWTSVLEQSAEGIVICDTQERIMLMNPAFERLTGYAEHEVIGKTPRILHSGRQGNAFYENMWKSLIASGHWHGEIWNRRKNGEVYVEWLSVSAVYDANGATTHYVGIFSDITQSKEGEQRMVHLAHYDALTDLPNRVLLMDRLQQLVKAARRDQSKIAVLFLDLDRFKSVNDSMGHDAGDILLQTVASRIVESVRQGDTVARMGGDEFVVVLPQLREVEDAAVIARKLLACIVQPMIIQNQEISISGSVGIAIFPDDGTETRDIIRNADAAMYEAKESGRHTYRFYTRDMNERAFEMLSMENALRGALERGEFVLHYQPQIDVVSGTIVGAEGLIRWKRPGFDLVLPGRFIRIAEERGLITSIGRWVIEEASRQIIAWDKARMPAIPIAVNISSIQFHQKGFAEHVLQTVRDFGIKENRLELELTEGLIIRDTLGTIEVLHRMHDMGVRLSIDDFGTGYSSLNYLRRFPIDKIKIDQSFVKEMTQHVDTVRVVRGIIGLAKSLNLRVNAEGVETHEQLRILRAEGCDEVQGFLFSAAVPPEEFQTLFHHWRSSAGSRVV